MNFDLDLHLKPSASNTFYATFHDLVQYDIPLVMMRFGKKKL